MQTPAHKNRTANAPECTDINALTKLADNPTINTKATTIDANVKDVDETLVTKAVMVVKEDEDGDVSSSIRKVEVEVLVLIVRNR